MGKINSVKETQAQAKYKRPTSKEKSQKKRRAKDDNNGNVFDIDIEGQF